MKNWLIRILLYIPLLGIGYYYKEAFGTADSSGLSCMVYQKTGWLCPGCGGQRALQSLLRRDVLEAIRYNALILLLIPLLLFIYISLIEVYVVKNQKYIGRIVLPKWFPYVLVLVIIVFSVMRNI